MVKSRRAASSSKSSVKATTARRPKVSTSRRKVVTSNGRPSATTVTVPCSMPVGTALEARRRASAITALRARVGRDVDVGDRPAEQRVAHAAADEERRVARRPSAPPRPPGSPGPSQRRRPGHGSRIRSAKRLQHPRRRAPDVMRPVGDHVVAPQHAPATPRPWTCRLAGSSAKASGTSKTSSTSRPVGHAARSPAAPGRRRASPRSRSPSRAGRAARAPRPAPARARSPPPPRAAPRRAASRRPAPACRPERPPGPDGACRSAARRVRIRLQPAAALDQRHQHRGRRAAAAPPRAAPGVEIVVRTTRAGRRLERAADAREVDDGQVHRRYMAGCRERTQGRRA